MPLITDIVQQKNKKNYFSIFIDNQFSFSLSQADIDFLQLKINQSLSREKYQEFLNNYVLQKAKTYVFNLLSRKFYTERELSDKLIAKYPEQVCQQVLNELKNLNYLNDQGLIYDYAKNKLSLKPRGPLKLKRELLQKKFNKELIDQTVERLYQEYDQKEMAFQLAEKKIKKYNQPLDKKDLIKIQQYLLSNGFSYNVISEITSRIRNKKDE